MKSSTTRRSALSRESMDIIENLANESTVDYNQDSYDSGNYAPSEYYRESSGDSSNNKSKEIDLLWQSFKSAQLNTNSTFMHVLGGFVLGVIVTGVIMAFWGMFTANSDNVSSADKLPIVEAQSQEQKIDGGIENASVSINETGIVAPKAEKSSVVKEKKANKKVSKNNNEAVQTPTVARRYVIKQGDTVEAIIKNNYGAYTNERAEAIMKANNLTDLDHISIDQVLILPTEQ